MAVLVRSCCVNVALTTAIAMTATAVYPAAQAPALQADKAAYSVVNMPVLALASLESSLAAVDAAAQPAITSPREATQAVAPAAANLGDFLYDFARNVALGVAVAVLPLWWIAFPVTLPIGAALNFFPNYSGGLAEAFFLFGGPIILVNLLFPPRESAISTASPSASIARSSAASPASLSETATASADVSATQLKSDSENEKPAAPRSNRPAKSAAAVVSTEALEKRDDAPSMSKGNATSSRQSAGQRRLRDEAPQQP